MHSYGKSGGRILAALFLMMGLVTLTGATVAAADQASPVPVQQDTSLTLSKVMCDEITFGNNSADCTGRDGSLDGQSITFSVTTSAGDVSASVTLQGGEGSTTLKVPAGDLTVCENAPSGTVRSFRRTNVPGTGGTQNCGSFAGEAISNHGGAITVTFFNQLGGAPPPPPAGSGTISVHKVDGKGASLGGSCFAIWTDAGNGVPGNHVAGQCDNDGDGYLTFAVPAGQYVVVESWAPPGYLVAGSQAVTVTSGKTTSVTVADQPGGLVLQVNKTDDQGKPLGGACFKVVTSGGSLVAQNCDGPQGGPYDGVIFISGLGAGNYTLVETLVPAGYQKAADQPFTVTSDDVHSGTKSLTVTDNPIAPGKGQGLLEIHKVDEHGKPLPGACFLVYQNNIFITNACDGADGNNDGTLFFTLDAGDYILTENHAPQGYIAGGRTSATVTANETTTVNVANTPGGVGIEVHKLDENGKPLGGVCFALRHKVNNGSQLVNSLCDAPQGKVGSGVVVFRGIAPGDYVIHEQRAPEGYALAPDKSITITEAEQGGPNVVVNITDQKSSGAVTPTVQPTQSPGGGKVTPATGTKTPAASGATTTTTKATAAKGGTVKSLPVTGAGQSTDANGLFALLAGAASLLLMAGGVALRRSRT